MYTSKIILYVFFLWQLGFSIAALLIAINLKLTTFIVLLSVAIIWILFTNFFLIYIEKINYDNCISLKGDFKKQIKKEIFKNLNETKRAIKKIPKSEVNRICYMINYIFEHSKKGKDTTLRIKIIVDSLQRNIMKIHDDDFNLVVREKILEHILESE